MMRDHPARLPSSATLRPAQRARRSAIAALLLIASAAAVHYLTAPPPARSATAGLVISQVYGGGGNSGAPLRNDFIELFNRGSATVNVTGWSVQYTSATGTSWQVTTLSGSIAPGQYYLVQQASGGASGALLPAADAAGTIAMAATAGKVALVNHTTALSGSCPFGSNIVDFVGYGSSANCFEGGGPTPTLSNTTAALRGAGGCAETNSNAADFTAGAPNPRNTASPTNVCSATANPSGVGAANPDPVLAGSPTRLTVIVTPGINPLSTGLMVTGDLTALGGAAAQPFFDDGTHGDETANDCVFSFLITVDGGTSAGVKNLPVTIADDQARTGSVTLSLAVQVPAPPSDIVISQIYGGGGNTGATFRNDFIELFHRGSAAINLTGWSVQYASATGTTWQVTPLSGSLAPGQYYLIQQAQGAGGTTNLPAPDAAGTIVMAATAGKVALVKHSVALSGGCPVDPGITDFVGYGTTATCFEGAAPTAAPSNTTAALRLRKGCADTNQNAADFATGPPNPRNTSSPFNDCGATADLAVTKSGPATVLAGGMIAYTITVTNLGPSAASDVVITDTLPSGLSNVSASDGGIPTGNLITWPTIASLPKDAGVMFTVMANAPAVAGELLNLAQATSDTLDPISDNNQAAVTTTVLAGAKFIRDNVRLTLSDPAECTGPGNVLIVTATFTNTGFTPQGNNAGPEFVAQLPPQLLALPGTCAASSGVCAVANPSQVTWNGAVGVNETITITYQAQINNGVPVGTQLCLEATVNYDSNNDGTNDALANATACVETDCPPSAPGDPFPADSAASDQKPGSVLIYNLYTSNATRPQRENTRINLTNIHPSRTAVVHLFFVEDDAPSVADAFVCLTANQTVSFLASDLDPGTAGYIVAVAVDQETGCPINFNFLIGDEYVKLTAGHAANLTAEAFAALPGAAPNCDAASATAELLFDGVSYNLAPRVLAADAIPSPADGNSTLLVINRLGGSLATGASTLGDVVGLLFDDTENAFSFNFSSSRRQLRQTLSAAFPRTTPRFPVVIPGGRSGWMRFWRATAGALLGALLNSNPQVSANAAAFNGGRNLHKLTLTSAASVTIPVFPPPC
jgi:uncharacterized repeat protein (TIGR01451 family)